jgi:HSP20 family molecular chaperone IbpA
MLNSLKQTDKNIGREIRPAWENLSEGSIPLPGNVNLDKAQASFKNGVLTVRWPKEGRDNAKSIRVS